MDRKYEYCFRQYGEMYITGELESAGIASTSPNVGDVDAIVWDGRGPLTNAC